MTATSNAKGAIAMSINRNTKRLWTRFRRLTKAKMPLRVSFMMD
jgi:hypothetical protein